MYLAACFRVEITMLFVPVAAMDIDECLHHRATLQQIVDRMQCGAMPISVREPVYVFDELIQHGSLNLAARKRSPRT